MPTLSQRSPIALVPFVAALGCATTPSPPEKTGVLAQLAQILAAELDLEGIRPQDLSLVNVGYLAGARRNAWSSIWDYCPTHAVDEPAALTRRGRIADFSFSRREQVGWNAQVGLTGSDLNRWLPDLVVSGDGLRALSVKMRIHDVELIALEDATFSRYLHNALPACTALNDKVPFEYVAELLVGNIEFDFSRKRSTGAGVKVGWSLAPTGIPMGTPSVNGPSADFAADGIAGAEDGIAGAEDGIAGAEDGIAGAEDGIAGAEDGIGGAEDDGATEGDMTEQSEASDALSEHRMTRDGISEEGLGDEDIGDAFGASPNSGRGTPMLGISADGRWRAERGAKIRSNGKLVFAILRKRYPQ